MFSLFKPGLDLEVLQFTYFHRMVLTDRGQEIGPVSVQNFNIEQINLNHLVMFWNKIQLQLHNLIRYFITVPLQLPDSCKAEHREQLEESFGKLD